MHGFRHVGTATSVSGPFAQASTHLLATMIATSYVGAPPDTMRCIPVDAFVGCWKELYPGSGAGAPHKTSVV